jgi:hypothetical protein
MITGSVSNNTLTFTKGDNTTFNLTVNTGSATAVVMAVSSSGSTIYSVNPATSDFNTSASIFLGTQAGASAINAYNSNFIGVTAGYSASYANTSNFMGDEAGYNAYTASASNFIGRAAGYEAAKADNSNFLGFNAGYQATNANSSNFIGYAAGNVATNANSSNFIGYYAGNFASSSSFSNFIGQYAGSGAVSSSNAIMIGTSAGQAALSASYSILVGWRAGRNWTTNGIGTNNIVIGTNITLDDDRKDSINIGGVIFATGSYSTLAGNNFSGSMTDAKVGINKSLPQYTLDVSGSVGVATILNIASSNPLPAGSIGNLAVSASNLYFYSASAWYQVQLV